MRQRGRKAFLRPWLWLVRLIGVIVPRRLRADWRREWEAELRHRERLLERWDQLNWRTKLDMLWHSAGAFADALWLQPKRLEDEMFQDLRFGLRMLLKSPGFTAVALLSLALGIGANTAIFSLMDAIFWRPLPVSHPEQLVSIVIPLGEREEPGFTPLALFRELQNGNQVFTGAITSGADGLSLTVDGATERVMGEVVT